MLVNRVFIDLRCVFKATSVREQKQHKWRHRCGTGGCFNDSSDPTALRALGQRVSVQRVPAAAPGRRGINNNRKKSFAVVCPDRTTELSGSGALVATSTQRPEGSARRTCLVPMVFGPIKPVWLNRTVKDNSGFADSRWRHFLPLLRVYKERTNEPTSLSGLSWVKLGSGRTQRPLLPSAGKLKHLYGI